MQRPRVRPLGRRGRATRFIIALALLVTAGIGLPSTTTPAHASYGISTEEGIDGCGWSTASSKAFFTATPYWDFGLYYGGVNATCPLGSSFASTLMNQGWKLFPLWVGPQSQCWSASGTKFSNDPTTAYDQGRSEAGAAYRTLLGWGWDMSNTPMIYDLEGFSVGNISACQTAAKNFMTGWVSQSHIGVPQKAGVYGSVCSSYLNSYSTLGAYVPDFIDGADWGTSKNTTSMDCISNGNWVNSQRIKQYTEGHNETWNGYTINVDNDCLNAPTYPSGGSSSQGCA